MTVRSLMLNSCQTWFLFHVKNIVNEYAWIPQWSCLETQKSINGLFLGHSKDLLWHYLIPGSGQEVMLRENIKSEWVNTEVSLLLFSSALWLKTSQSWGPRGLVWCSWMCLQLNFSGLVLWNFFIFQFPTDPVPIIKYFPAFAFNLLMINSESHTAEIIE